MKMSSLKFIYMEILLIETQTEITTFKAVMVTGWCQHDDYLHEEKQEEILFGTTYSGVVVVFCNRLKRLNSNYKQNSKQ